MNKRKNIQAILFNKQFYTAETSRKWLNKHHFTPIKRVHITDEYLRYRLTEPSKLKRYRTINLGENVKAIISFSKKK